MNPLYKQGVLTTSIYAVLIITGYMLNQLYPSVCGLGIGLLYILFVFPALVFLGCLRDLYFLVRGRKEFYLSMTIHLVIVCCMLIVFQKF